MRNFLKIIDTINEWVGRLSSFSVILLTVIVATEVIRRYVFNRPSLCGFEYSKYVYGFHFMIVAGYVLLHKGHVAIDIVYTKLSSKTKTILDIISYLIFFFPFFAIMFWQGFLFAKNSWLVFEKDWTICESPVYPAKTVIPIAVFLLLLQGLSVFIKKLYLIITNVEID
jgi:TRAP-type mannitol/chloroaromatic compound transport system permease small subunit